MSDPKRLLESGDAFERELLNSALPDRGSPRALQRTLSSIGLGTALTVASTASAKAASSALTASAVLKWVGIGAVAGLATARNVDLAARARPAAPLRASIPAAPSVAEPQARRISGIVGPAAANPSATAGVTPTAVEPPTGELADARQSAAQAVAAMPQARPAQVELPSAVTTSMSRAETSPAAQSAAALPAVPASAEHLLREVRALDRAKSALQSGDAAGALKALDDHARAFPKAALRPEANLLRVRALVLSGNRAAALALARRIVGAQPNGAHARAVVSLLPELAKANASNP